MKKIFVVLFCVFLYSENIKGIEKDFSKVKPVRNVILMIPDGTPYSILSVTRWVNWYKDKNMTNLSIDPYLCGFVRSNTVLAPIADSGSSTSCYVSGHVQPSGFIGTYSPDFGSKNLGPVDSTKAYGPVANVFEAAQQIKGKSTGLVATVSFTHATPADCSAHFYRRSKEYVLASQIVHNNFDVVVTSGNKYLNSENEKYLKDNGYLATNQIVKDGSTWYYVDASGRITKTMSAMDRKAQAYTSNTDYLILVDRDNHTVGIYEGSYENWTLDRSFLCGNGKASTQTITGSFNIPSKYPRSQPYFDSGSARCWYPTRIYGGYLFHSVLYYQSSSPSSIMDGRLGVGVSHGCVRLALNNAKYIYDNIPIGTKVVIY